MARSPFGNAKRYTEALKAVLADGVPPKHLDMARHHLGARRRTCSVRDLAHAVGYASWRAVNLQYGTFARRVGEQLGLTAAPHGFWLYAIVDWADQQPSGEETQFVLRPEFVEAPSACGVGLPVRSVAKPKRPRA